MEEDRGAIVTYVLGIPPEHLEAMVKARMCLRAPDCSEEAEYVSKIGYPYCRKHKEELEKKLSIGQQYFQEI